MSAWWTLLFAVSFVLVLLVALRRANELFCVSVNDGRARHVRGRMPPALFHDIQDIVAAAGIARAVLRVVSESGAPRLLPHPGLNQVQQQQLRNVIGRFNITQIRAGRSAGR